MFFGVNYQQTLGIQTKANVSGQRKSNLDDGLVDVVVVGEFDESESLLLAGILVRGALHASHLAELKQNHFVNVDLVLDHYKFLRTPKFSVQNE